MPKTTEETGAPTTLPHPTIEPAIEEDLPAELLETAFILPATDETDELDTGDLIDAAEELLRQGAPHDFDVAVIGAGPGGLACAIELAKSNLKVVLIENRENRRRLSQSRLHPDQNAARIGRRAARRAPRPIVWRRNFGRNND